MNEKSTSLFDSNSLSGPKYWRSLDDLAKEPAFQEFVKNEFPEGASELNGFNRRHFMKVMAASFAMAGLGGSGCRRPKQDILPYSKQPERLIPGLPVYYASSYPTAKDNIPVTVETHQARPTKIEGNPQYTSYNGSTDTYTQASVLDLYDPDRSTHSSIGGKKNHANVDEILSAIRKKYHGNRGLGLAFLADESTSPTRARLVETIKRTFPRAIWAEYEAVDYNNPEKATKGLFSGYDDKQKFRPSYNLRKAKRILSIDSDFLATEPSKLRYAADFAAGRRVVDLHRGIHPEKMNRLYQVEATFTQTGAMADHRLRIAASQIPAFTAALTAQVLSHLGKEADFVNQLKTTSIGVQSPNDEAGFLDKWIRQCAKDLIDSAKENATVVIAGSQQSEEVHQLVYYLNETLGAVGNTVDYLELPKNEATSIAAVANNIRSGRTETLIILNGNPAYNAPSDIEWLELQQNLKAKGDPTKGTGVIRFGYHFDETSEEANAHIAATHYLEAWGDGRSFDGTIVPVQPMTAPLYNGLTEIEILAKLLGLEQTDPYSLVRATLKRDDRYFNKFLSTGVLPGSAFKKRSPSINLGKLRQFILNSNKIAPPVLGKGKLEVVIRPSSNSFDGRFNNNGWCQELPDAMTKICWDNVISISPRLAKEIGIDPTSRNLLGMGISAVRANEFEMGREVAPVYKVSIGGNTIEGPLHVQPGLANNTVVVTLGYGRTKTGHVGRGTGYNAFPLKDSANPFVRTGVKLAPVKGKTKLIANTQEHWSMEGRAIIRETSVENYEAHPDFVDHIGMESHSPPILGISKDKSLQEQVKNQFRGSSSNDIPKFGGEQQWGMSIDLNTCIACNACVVACQSENNIPVVGKDQVTRGREMHWIRLDRYYVSGSLEKNFEQLPEDPQIANQPVACQHCEMAPCESVCPVNATVHDDSGLNTMAYNRCVGTRYCSNNCPYKVRRFNFFDWNKYDTKDLYKVPLGIKEGLLGKKEGTLHKNNGLQHMQKNPDVSVRMRGVMEKCTYCTQRIEAAKINQKVTAKDSNNTKVPDGIIKTACEQVCPTNSIVFGDLADASTRVSILKKNKRDYGVLGYLNTRPRTTYLARVRNPNQKMPDSHDQPLSQLEYEEKSGGHAPHGGDHGNGHDAHGAKHSKPAHKAH